MPHALSETTYNLTRGIPLGRIPLIDIPIDKHPLTEHLLKRYILWDTITTRDRKGIISRVFALSQTEGFIWVTCKSLRGVDDI